MRAKVGTLGVLGAGVIGAGWAARARHVGIDVIVVDADPGMERPLRDSLAVAAPALDALTEGIALPEKGGLIFTTDIDALAQADFVQENVPERADVKADVLARVSAVAAPDVVIASSTSGFMPAELRPGVTAPERLIVGHPFNPVYLIPLVEVVGNQATAPAALAVAERFYLSLGMHPLRVRAEVPGHLSDRLQEAMWREILHALADDIATTDELDQSLAYGPGLRWAVMGMCQLFAMAGGEGGARHFMHQFGPALDSPWSHNPAPPLTEALIDRFADGTAAQAGGKSLRELEAIRDECLVAIQRVLARHDIAAGRALNAFARARAGD